MMVKFVCTYEGWQNSYDVVFVPNIGHDVTFSTRKTFYEVIGVKHEAISLNQRNARSEPTVKVYVRPRGLGQEAKYLRRVSGGGKFKIDPYLHAIDPDTEERRVSELNTHDYRE